MAQQQDQNQKSMPSQKNNEQRQARPQNEETRNAPSREGSNGSRNGSINRE